MKRKNRFKNHQWVYSHIASEVFMNQYSTKYVIFAVCGCGNESDSLSVAEELADHLAGLGKKTLLINTDVYPYREKLFHIEDTSDFGFSDYINGTAGANEIISVSCDGKFNFIGRGRSRADEAEQILCSPKGGVLLSSLRRDFDIIILHTPSLTASVSGRILCRFADTAILVAAAGKTKKIQLEDGKKQMDELNVPVAGVIATRSKKTLWEQFSRWFDRQSKIV